MTHSFLSDLAIFLLTFGEDLRRVLRNPSLIRSNPRAGVWLESAERLGVVKVSDGEISIDFEAIKRLIEKVKQVFDEWISELSQ